MAGGREGPGRRWGRKKKWGSEEVKNDRKEVTAAAGWQCPNEEKELPH